MQGCFKSSLHILRTARTGERGQFYSASFNFAIGLERLLKILLLLDHWHRERKFPDSETLKKYGGKSGHNVAMLYQSAQSLFPKYGTEWKDPDAINRDLLNFSSDFANGSRYFNLNTLGGQSKATDPIKRWEVLLYRVHAKDIRNENSAKTSAAIQSPEPESLSATEFAVHHTRMAAASPHICWRAVQLLIPMRDLLIAVCAKIQQDDFRIEGDAADASVPYMEEFLDFICSDKNIILTA